MKQQDYVWNPKTGMQQGEYKFDWDRVRKVNKKRSTEIVLTMKIQFE